MGGGGVRGGADWWLKVGEGGEGEHTFFSLLITEVFVYQAVWENFFVQYWALGYTNM